MLDKTGVCDGVRGRSFRSETIDRRRPPPPERKNTGRTEFVRPMPPYIIINLYANSSGKSLIFQGENTELSRRNKYSDYNSLFKIFRCIIFPKGTISSRFGTAGLSEPQIATVRSEPGTGDSAAHATAVLRRCDAPGITLPALRYSCSGSAVPRAPAAA